MPLHEQQLTDLQAKDAENKKLLGALQKAHGLGETAKRELKSEVQTLRHILAHFTRILQLYITPPRTRRVMCST